MKISKLMPVLIIAIIVVVVIFLVGKASSNSSSNALSLTDQRINVQKPKAQQAINKEFLFPLKDASGKEVSKLKFYIENAQLNNEIIVKGQRATAIQGRTFLIFNIKITNNYDKAVSINSRDYFRLMVNNNGEKLAPDIHNDPVEIQPISTKYSRLGFPINDTDKNLILQVGEVAGPKTDIKLENLK
jgi:uncharacterized protein (UPF0333 family)